MKRIAILQFPGLNSEYETKRAVDDAGMEGVIFRWNGNRNELAKFDGFIIPGGFSYEDRGRAGLITSLDPIMDVIRSEVATGKPLLGICNGAQVVVETCMVPGSGKLELCLANNKRVKDGEIVGTGFLNVDVDLKTTATKGRCAFNLTLEKDSLHRAPIAHGEGRFTTVNLAAVLRLEEHDQIIFKYCDSQGEVVDNYPINPNGTFKNAAAICNEVGNVMAIMPHPERAYTAPIPEIFKSMRIYLEEYLDKGKGMIPETAATNKSDYSLESLQQFENKNAYFEIFVDLIITDNTAETFTNTLGLMGFDVNVKRQVHYTVNYDENSDPLQIAKALIKSGELLNVNKEVATVQIAGQWYKFDVNSEELKPMDAPASQNSAQFYVKDREDFFGQSKTEKIQKHLVGKNTNLDGFKFVVEGTIWTVVHQGNLSNNNEDQNSMLNSILQTNIFANPHSQDLLKYA